MTGEVGAPRMGKQEASTTAIAAPRPRPGLVIQILTAVWAALTLCGAVFGALAWNWGIPVFLAGLGLGLA